MRKGIFYILLGVFLVGIVALFNKLAIDSGINPTVYITIRICITVILLGIAVLLTEKEKISQLTDTKNWKYIFVIALVGTVFSKLSSMWGLSMIDLSIMTLIKSLSVILAIVFSYFLLNERLTRKFFLFSAGIIVGIGFIVWPLENFVLNIGYLLAMVSGGCYALSHVFMKKANKKINALNLNFGRLLIGAIILIPITLLTAYDQIPTIMNGWQYLIAASIFSAAGGTIAIKGIQKEGASMQASLNGFKRIWVILLSVIFLGEIITLEIFIGGIIILACVYFITKTKAKYIPKVES